MGGYVSQASNRCPFVVESKFGEEGIDVEDDGEGIPQLLQISVHFDFELFFVDARTGRFTLYFDDLFFVLSLHGSVLFLCYYLYSELLIHSLGKTIGGVLGKSG